MTADGTGTGPGVSLRDVIRSGSALTARDGRRWTYRGFDANGLARLESRGDRLRLPGADGLPRFPDEASLRAAIRLGDLRISSSEPTKSIRRNGRRTERNRQEVLTADPKAALRMLVCRAWDRAVTGGKRPTLDDPSIAAWVGSLLEGDPLAIEFGIPSPSATKEWVATRGLPASGTSPGDRRWADMENLAGQGRRRKRIVGLSYELAQWHAARVHSRGTLNPAAAHRALERDFNRARCGKLLKMDGFRPVERDYDGLKLMDPTTFRKLVNQLDTAANDARRTNHLSMRARRGGEGASIEAVRFGQIVQLDEKESSAYVLVSERRRIPLGNVTTSIAVDCHTTAIFGRYVGWSAPNASTALRTLIDCGSLKEVPEPFRDACPILELLATRISELIVDNASHLSGETIQDLGGDLVMDVVWAGDRVATHKALVESRHAIIRRYVDDRLPNHKLPIAIAREYGVDLSERTAVDVVQYRRLFDLGIAEYNTTRRADLGGRSPLELAMADVRLHRLQLPSDLAQYERALGSVAFSRVIGGEGVVVEGLVYAHPTEHSRLLDDLVHASADRRRTRRLRLECKVKTYTDTVERIAVFNPRRGAYEDLYAKRRRYAADLTPELHRIIVLGLHGQDVERVSEERLLELRGRVEDILENADPAALARSEDRHERILSDPATMALAIDRIEVARQRPSPTGLETATHDLDLRRHDATTKPVRRKRGSVSNRLQGTDRDGEEHGVRDHRDAERRTVAPTVDGSRGSAAEDVAHGTADPDPIGRETPATTTPDDDEASPFDVY